MAAVRKMLLVEARRSWETRGAPRVGRWEELVTRLMPRVDMDSEADLWRKEKKESRWFSD